MITGKELAFLLVIALAAAGCAGGGEEGGEGEATGDSPSPSPDMAGASDATPRVVLETSKGQIVMELDREKAPRTVANFLEHVEGGFYDSLTFHRVIPGFMIQAGGYTPNMSERRSPRPSVVNESDNQLKNVRGTVAMARLSDPHSAKTQFFINLVDNPNLDYNVGGALGYTVFGQVVQGMSVVDSIAQVPTHTVGPYENVPAEPVVIERAYVSSDSD